jgi:hypothetical protein
VPDTTRITLRLTRAQALVLFEFLGRESEGEQQQLTIAHPAEQHVLWLVEGQLEKLLDEVLDANYRDLLNKARDEVTSG